VWADGGKYERDTQKIDHLLLNSSFRRAHREREKKTQAKGSADMFPRCYQILEEKPGLQGGFF